MRHRRRKGRKLTKSQQMARVRSRDTIPETALRKALWSRGFRYRVRPALPGTPDLAFTRARVTVFVDGCFWHKCPEHYREPATNVEFWRRKVARNVARDQRVDEELADLGWSVTRIWEHEALSNSQEAVDYVIQAVESATPGVPTHSASQQSR